MKKYNKSVKVRTITFNEFNSKKLFEINRHKRIQYKKSNMSFCQELVLERQNKKKQLNKTLTSQKSQMCNNTTTINSENNNEEDNKPNELNELHECYDDYNNSDNDKDSICDSDCDYD